MEIDGEQGTPIHSKDPGAQPGRGPSESVTEPPGDSLSPERWHQADRLFAEALALPEARRAAYLDQACGDDSELHRCVRQILADDDALDSFLEQPLAAWPVDAARIAENDLGEELGPYRLLGRLGAGGMGAVYLAEQQHPVERKVALKLVRAGMDCEQVLARFEGERQALAMMDHNNVARVYDAGSTAAGRSYFAMEYVPGLEITRHCDRFGLGFRARVRLFLQVCDGVQHAHQKGLIHRDLKPSNILVKSSQGEPPTVKIIDFGVAKSLQGKLSADAAQTQLGTFVGTPIYSSPEQILGRDAETDTRSDIFSLGVVLYELLVGSAPHATEEFVGKSPLQIAQQLCDHEPPTPIERFTTSKVDAETIARRRSLSVEQMQRRLRGDLSWILLRCLARCPDDRYPSVFELRKDLERWLAGQAIEARPATGLYRLRKLVRRHRLPVALAAAVTLALLATTTAAVLGFVRAEQAASAARQAALEAEMAADFQAAQLQALDPAAMGLSLRAELDQEIARQLRERGWRPDQIESAEQQLALWTDGVSFTDLTLTLLDEQIFDRALQVIEGNYGEFPLLQARLWQTVADTLHELGRLEQAMEPQEKALERRRSVLGLEDPLTLASLRSRGVLEMQLGRLEDAEADLSQALEVARRNLGEEHPETLRILVQRAWLGYPQACYAEGEERMRRAVAGLRRVLGSDHPETLEAIDALGVLLVAQGKLEDAEPLHLEAMEGRRRVLGNGHSATLDSIGNTALLLYQLGKSDEAEAHFREALEGKRRMFGTEHPATLTAISNLGAFLQFQGRAAEAAPFLQEAFAVRRRVLGSDHVSTLISHKLVARLARDRGLLGEAESAYRRTLDGLRRVLGDEHLDTLNTLGELGGVLRQRGKLDEALELGQESVRTGRQALDGHYRLGVWLTDYGRTLAAAGRVVEAEALLGEAEAILTAAGPSGAPHLEATRRGLVELAEVRSAQRRGPHAAVPHAAVPHTAVSQVASKRDSGF